VAYQVIGSGPVDVLVARSSIFSIESMWDEPRLVHFLSQLSAFSRHIWFDFRGTGASDAIAPTESQLLESMVDDMVAVVDAVGCDRALVLVLGAPAGLVFAATRPERTASVAIVNTVARYRRADDYPEGLSDELVEERLSAASLPTAAIVAPSLGSDVPFTRWLGRASRLMVPPNERRVRLRALYDHDVRGVLGSVQAPALVIYGRDTADADRYRFVGEHIPGARLVEVDGGDPFPIADSGPIVELIEQFATGGLSAPVSDRALATVLFTDLVSSTEQVSEVGDRRWRNLMEAHDALVRSEVDRLQGKVIRFTGDGVLATFDGPARAIRCACAIRDVLAPLGLVVRAGLHTGEIDLHGDDVSGISVHIGQRVCVHAGPGEVLVSRTVADLIAGSDIELEDAGEHELKGVTGSWRLLRVANA